jgi:hypothetical protein
MFALGFLSSRTNDYTRVYTLRHSPITIRRILVDSSSTMANHVNFKALPKIEVTVLLLYLVIHFLY